MGGVIGARGAYTVPGPAQPPVSAVFWRILTWPSAEARATMPPTRVSFRREGAMMTRGGARDKPCVRVMVRV